MSPHIAASAGPCSAEATVPLAAPQDMLARLIGHLAQDHGMTFVAAPDGTQRFAQEGYGIAFAARAEALFVGVEAPGENALLFAKDSMVQHLAAFDPDAAARLRWHGGQGAESTGKAPANFRLLEVRDSREVFDGMQRVTLHYPGIARLQEQGVHFRLALPGTPDRAPVWPVMGANGAPVWPKDADALHLRYVTLRAFCPETEEVEIDVVRHAGGRLSRWAQQARPGQVAGAMGPVGQLRPGAAQSCFIAADGTGLAAVAQLVRRLPEGVTGDVVLALPPGTAPREYLPPTGLRLYALPPERFDLDLPELARICCDPARTDYGFFAGEAATAARLRTYFKDDLGLDRQQMSCTAYWQRTA